MVPRRCCLCLHCRTALVAGGGCDCEGAASVACFEVPEERAQIVEASWGDASDRREVERMTLTSQRRVLATSMGGFSLLGTVAYGVAGLGPGVLVWGMLGSLAGGMVARYKGIRDRPQPRGATLGPPKTDVSLRGKVLGKHQLLSPATAEECLAYSIELRVLSSEGERVMYRDAVTSGFAVELGTGEVVEITAGRVRFLGDARVILDVDNLELDAYLEDVDPLRDAAEELHPLHFNLVREEVLFAGDDVELGGHFERKSVPGESQVLYRDSVPSHLRPTAVPLVRRLR